MTSKTTVRSRIVKHVALGAVVAAVAAPVAQAQTPIPAELANEQFRVLGVTIPDELSGRQFGPSNVRLVTIPEDLSGRQYAPTFGGNPVAQQPGTIPAELDGRQFGPSTMPLVTIPEDLSGRELGPATFTTDLPVTIPVAVADRFDWRDAGVGAAIVAAVALMLGAVALVIGRRRHLAGA
jgi:hypothetical protein